MDPVNGINQIVQILRKKIGERSTATVSKSDSSAGGMSNAQTQRRSIASAEDIQRKIGARIRALSEDQRHGTKATQVFVETIITWELGDGLLQDPRFAQLSKDVVNTIDENKVLRSQMRELLQQLQQIS